MVKFAEAPAVDKKAVREAIAKMSLAERTEYTSLIAKQASITFSEYMKKIREKYAEVDRLLGKYPAEEKLKAIRYTEIFYSEGD